MSADAILSCLAILAGAVVMLTSIIRARNVLAVAPLLPERRRARTMLYLKLHRGLMVFFLIGYLLVFFAFAFDFHLVGRLFVGLIFLAGAVFVLMGTWIQSRLLAEVEMTLRGLVPICAGCKKIRTGGTDVDPEENWEPIEAYIGSRANVDFSHGLCPGCLEVERGRMNEVLSRQRK